MINIPTIKQEFTGWVGWKQPTTPGYEIIDDDNQVSASGLYLNESFHKLVTIRNIKESQENKDISFEDFNTLIKSLYDNAVIKVINTAIDGNDLVENLILYPNENRMYNGPKIPFRVGFVGYEIKVSQRKDLSTVINAIMAEFDEVATFNLYLFHSSKRTPLATIPITTIKDSTAVKLVELMLSYSTHLYKGGQFYLGYLGKDMITQAYDRQWSLANVKSQATAVSFKQITVPGWDKGEMFDVDNIHYVSECQGLNFDISVVNDYTDTIITNKRLFTHAIGYQVAADVLEMIIMSTRSNLIERETRANANFELNGANSEELPKTIGIKEQIRREVAKIKKNLFNKQPVTRGTIHQM